MHQNVVDPFADYFYLGYDLPRFTKFCDIHLLELGFHHLGSKFINEYIVNLLQTWLIETEGNLG